MKKQIVFLTSTALALVIGIAIGAETKQDAKTNIKNPLAETVSQQQDDIKYLKSENELLSGSLGTLHRLLEKNWRFELGEIDDGLDAVERDDTKSVGSYTDWFMPTLQDLKERGVGKWRLQQRIDRLIVLAEKKKYLSSYERDIIEREGIDGLRKDASSVLQ